MDSKRESFIILLYHMVIFIYCIVVSFALPSAIGQSPIKSGKYIDKFRTDNELHYWPLFANIVARVVFIILEMKNGSYGLFARTFTWFYIIICIFSMALSVSKVAVYNSLSTRKAHETYEEIAWAYPLCILILLLLLILELILFRAN